MKLAEALALRAEQQKRMAQLAGRMVRNAKTQEGEPPAEDPNALLNEYNQVARQLVLLVQRINRTNSSTAMEGYGTIADAIAARDGLRLRADTHRQLADAGIVTQNAYSRSEIKFRTMVSVAALQAEADSLSRQHRELDTAIQSLNWTTELVE